MSELAYRRRRRSILLLVCLWYQAAVVNSWSEKTRTIVAGGRRILLSAPVKGPVFLTKSSSTRSSVTSKFTPAMVRQFPGTGERIAAPKTAIVITVHGALDYLAMCLDSIAQHSTGVHLFIADDSANETESAQVSR